MNEHRAVIDRTFRAILADGAILCIRFGPGQEIMEACRAGWRGGLRVVELTLTTPGAIEAMDLLAREAKTAGQGYMVGGGTVLTTDQVRAVERAGGRFVLSPVFDPRIVDAADRLGLLAIPGAATATEILAAHRHGTRAVKIFPSGPLGGPAFLKTVRGPLPEIPLIPTSGPDAENLTAYFKAGAVAVGVGAEVFPPGFTPESAEAAARRVRRAIDACRSDPTVACDQEP